MEFCPKCKSMMVPQEDEVKCRKCGFTKQRGNSTERRVHEISRNERTILVLEDEAAGMPTIKIRCGECGHDTAYWWLRQLRSADESEVRFFRCTKCGKTWREYD